MQNYHQGQQPQQFEPPRYPQYDDSMWQEPSRSPRPKQPRARQTMRHNRVKKTPYCKMKNKIKRFFKKIEPKKLAIMLWLTGCLFLGFWYKMNHKPQKVTAVKAIEKKEISYKGKIQK